MTAITMRLGNTSSRVDAETWRWRLFLETGEAASPFIDKVVLHLHPTFRVNTVNLERAGSGVFQSTQFTGWGTFQCVVDVHWKGETEPVVLTHMLVFHDRDNGHSAPISVPVPPSVMALAQPAVIHPPPATVPAGAATAAAAPDSMEMDGTAAPTASAPPQKDLPVLPAREDVIGRVCRTPFLEHSDERFWHGRAYDGPMRAPRKTWASDYKPRDDHDAPKWLTASEFTDTKEVMTAKVAALADLLRLSHKTVVYSGAGISRAAGIGQAARGAGGGGGKSVDALPTYTHYALGALSKAGLLHGWVQQNHDGLPQKAGFPQENINEIHGSWYDPSNPVVKYSGTLKSEQFPWMVDDAKTADLVLVLGTSLGGLNADQVAIKPAKRSCTGTALGTVMINLQQTEQDGKTSLRLFGQSDSVLRELVTYLGLEHTVACTPATFNTESRVLVPYDRRGRRSDTAKMWLDLRDGARVKLTEGHNVQGAQQPAYMHIGATKATGNGKKPGPGHGVVTRKDDVTVAFYLNIEGARMTLGQWWLEAAARGGPPTLPVVNIQPDMAAE